MRKWLKKLKFKIFLKIYHKTHVISSKGEMIMYYILNKYINGIKPDDYIEYYETAIAEHIKDFMPAAINCVEQLNVDESIDRYTLTKTVARMFAAFALFETLLISIPPKQRQVWYDRIDNEQFKTQLLEKITKEID